jgi:Right handed beta helix region
MTASRCARLLPLLALLAVSPALASDGVLEINQACATQTGCFLGDAADFPVTILQPGSYRLTSRLEGTSATIPVIDIQAEPVTLDLNGFDVQGNFRGPNPTGVGILGGQRVALRNGSVHHAASDGVRVGSSSRIDDLHVYANAGAGLVVGGESTIRGVVATSNGGNGITAGAASVIAGCTATVNGESGIELVYGSVTASTATQNAQLGGNFGYGVSFGGNVFAGNLRDVATAHASAGNFCEDRSCTTDGRKRYYLTNFWTQGAFDGATAANACESRPGFHMASLWEILDPSTLQYDFTYGEVVEPGSQGPPTARHGWLRTSNDGGNNGPGEANCRGATSASSADSGTISYIARDWGLGAQSTSPWIHQVLPCDTSARVWCVED